MGAEIGTYRGDFAAEILTTPVGKLFIIDCWDHQVGSYTSDPSNIPQGGHQMNERIVRERFSRDPRVKVIKEYSDLAGYWWSGEKLDWVFIDANHSYKEVLADLEVWSKNISESGSIFCHDFVDNENTRTMGFGVVEAVNDFCKTNPWRVVRVTDEEFPTCELKRYDT